MLNVSSTWKEAVKKQFRNQAYLKFNLKIVPPGLREGAILSSNPSNLSFTKSNINTIMDGLEHTPKHFITLEPNRWALDGSFEALQSDTVTSIWWSANALDTYEHAKISIVFDQVYSLPGVAIKWDTETNSHPTAFTISGQNTNTGNPTYQFTDVQVNDVSEFYSVPMQGVNFVQISLDPNLWNKSDWRARIDQITCGLVVSFNSINNGRVVSASTTDKSDPLSSTLPVHTMQITLRNLDSYFDPQLEEGISQYVSRRQVAKVNWGFNLGEGGTEWSPDMPYLLDSFKIPSDSGNVVFNLSSRLNFIDSDFKQGNWSTASRSLSTLAQYILSRSNVLKESDTQVPWVLPSVLNTMYAIAPIPALASNVLLQQIALAGCCWLTTNPETGFIEFVDKSNDTTVDAEITMGQELGDPSIIIDSQLKSVTAVLNTYTASATEISLGSSKYDLSGQTTVEIKYSKEFATAVRAEVANGTLVSATYYCSYATLTLSGTGQVTVELFGKEIEKTQAYIKTYNDSTVINGMEVTIDNPFITNMTTLNKVAEYVKNYYLKRNTYNISYIGYPELMSGDSINLTTKYGSGVVEVCNSQIDFNGAWTGKVEAY